MCTELLLNRAPLTQTRGNSPKAPGNFAAETIDAHGDDWRILIARWRPRRLFNVGGPGISVRMSLKPG